MRNRRLIGRIAVLLFGLFLTQRVVVQRPDNALGWDGFGYWLYLPLTIVHNDLGMQDPTIIEGIFKTYDPSGTFYQAHKAPTGNTVIRYTPGLAFIHLPGFLIAHALAEPLGSPADGFSTPYQYSALITYVLVIVFGLWVLRKVLDELFGPTIALAALLLILLGTNLLVYFETNPMMTHGYSFALLSLLLWLNMKWHKDPRMRTAIALGAVLGFIALVRPTDAIVALIPLLWPLRDHDLLGKFRAVMSQYRSQLFGGAFAALIAVSPLFIYWKVYAGSFFWDSYQNPGEGLDIFYPHIHNFLFSFRKGWLLYSPLIALALLGFIPLWRRHRRIAIALLWFFCIELYVVSSWTAWWYPGSFGQRGMIQAYPVVTFALAAGMEWLMQQRAMIGAPFVALSTLLVALSVHQSHQSRWGIWDHSRGTCAHYKAVFFDTHQDRAKKRLLSIDRSTDDRAAFRDPERYAVYKTDVGAIDLSTERTAPDGRPAFLINDRTPFTPAMENPFETLTPSDHAWLKVSAQVWCDSPFVKCNSVLVATFDHNGNYGYVAEELSSHSDLKPGQWNTVGFLYLTPEPRRPWDKFRLYGWNRGGPAVWIDSLRVTSLVRKEELK